LLDLAEQPEPFAKRSLQTDKQNVRTEPLEDAENVFPFSAKPDDVEIYFEDDEPFQAGQPDRVVTGQHQAYRLFGCHCSPGDRSRRPFAGGVTYVRTGVRHVSVY
jgi:hypothetical protein